MPFCLSGCNLKDLSDLQDRIIVAIEDLRNITMENLTPGQTMVFKTTADELDVTTGDLILYVRLHAWSTKGIFDNKDSFGDLVSQVSLLFLSVKQHWLHRQIFSKCFLWLSVLRLHRERIDRIRMKLFFHVGNFPRT